MCIATFEDPTLTRIMICSSIIYISYGKSPTEGVRNAGTGTVHLLVNAAFRVACWTSSDFEYLPSVLLMYQGIISAKNRCPCDFLTWAFKFWDQKKQEKARS